MEADSACLVLHTVTGTPPFDPGEMRILLNQTFFLDFIYCGPHLSSVRCLSESCRAAHEGLHLHFLPPDPHAALSVP